MFFSRKDSNPKIRVQKALNYKASTTSINGLMDNTHMIMHRTTDSNFVSPLLTKSSFAKSKKNPSIKINPFDKVTQSHQYRQEEYASQMGPAMTGRQSHDSAHMLSMQPEV